MLEWMEKEVFDALFLKIHESSDAYWLTEEFWISATLDWLKKRISVAPRETPVDEEDFPGPVLRWYGRVDGKLFLLTHYLAPNVSTVEKGDSTAIRCAPVDSDAFTWKCIEPFCVEASEFAGRLVWFEGKAGKNARHEVSLSFDARVVGPIYRADSREDAESFQKLLSSIASPGFEYRVKDKA